MNVNQYVIYAPENNFKKRPRYTKKELVNQQVIEDFDVGFKNGESKSVCRICRDTFESVKEFYFHLETHTDDRWNAFFEGRNPKVYNSPKALFGWEVETRKRSNSGLLVADDDEHVNINNKVPKTRNYLFGTKAVDRVGVDKDVQYAAETLVLMSRDHKSVPGGIIMPTDIFEAVEGLLMLANGPPKIAEGGSKMVHDFDLNALPPMEDDNSTKLIMA